MFQDLQWTQQLLPLPSRVIPQPWEDLPSLIIRSAECMGYESASWILRARELPYEIKPAALRFLSKCTDYHILQRLLHLDEEALYQCTYHRFVSVHSSSCWLPRRGEIKRPLYSQDILPDLFSPYAHTKVCPICLDDGIPYGRLYWGINSLVVCPQHNFFLIDRCPACCKPIPLFRTSLTHCPRCRTGDYRKALADIAQGDPYLQSGQRLILVHLGIQSVEETQGDDPVAVLAESPLLDLLPSQYFLLLAAFRHILPSLFPANPFLRITSDIRAHLKRPPQSSNAFRANEWRVIATTFPFIFASWPENFFAFINALINERCRERRTEYESQDIGPLGFVWLYKELQDPAFSFLREAYETYLKKHFVGHSRLEPQDRFYMSKLDARTKLGVSIREVENLIKQGLLREVRVPFSKMGKKPPTLIERTSVDTLQQDWENLLPWKKVLYSILGANKQVLHQFEKLQWLVPIRGPLVDNYPVQLYRATEVDRLVSTLLNLTVPVPRLEQEVLTLFDALLFERVTLARLLNEAKSGHLTLIDTENGPLFHRLVLTRAELSHLLDAGKDEHVKSEERGLLTLHEAAWHLGMSKPTLLCWVHQGLLSAVSGGDVESHLLFKREAIETFHSTYVGRREAARMLGILPGSIFSVIRRGILHPVYGQETGGRKNKLIYCRAEIEALMAEEEEG